jgi:hypothetical protein
MSEDKNKTVLNLVNPSFTFNFMGESYEVKKANLEKAIQYQLKASEIPKGVGYEFKLVSYCIYIVLKDVKPDITEEDVLKNIPADIDVMGILVTLGFMSQSKMEEAMSLAKAIEKKLTTGISSSSSLKEQDGLPNK